MTSKEEEIYRLKLPKSQHNLEDKAESTIQKIKSILKDYENQSIKNQENYLKTENIENELKSTLSLVNENPKKRLNELLNSLDNWIHSTKMEMEITKHALHNFEDLTANDKFKNKILLKNFIFIENLIYQLYFTLTKT